MKKLVSGVGVNDSIHPVNTKLNGKNVRCPFYEKWTGMLNRCYSSKFHKRNPTYIGCKVCDEWLTFSNFKRWMETQEWNGKHLDKDILQQGCKIYSPSTCIFVTPFINSLLLTRDARRGFYPLGVVYQHERAKFQSNIAINGKSKHLGFFDTEKQAHKSWQHAKANHIEDVANSQEDCVLKFALIIRVNQLRNDLISGKITTEL